jgi:hypothetical protein
MSNSPFQPRSGSPPGRPSHFGHAHFWERLRSRRQFLQTAGAAGLALGTGLWQPAPAWGDDDDKVVDPKPLPGGIHLPFVPNVPIFHFFQPGTGHEHSTITDFKGFIGVARFLGTGTGTDTNTGKKKALLFEADMRFMKGVYVGVDGKTHKGTFSFL